MASREGDPWRKYTDHIKESADKVYDRLWGIYKELVRYTPDSIEQIHKSFMLNHDYMKSEMESQTENLDRFKIVSAYTKAILAHPLFMPNEKAIENFYRTAKVPEIPFCIKFPNLYFIFIMIRSIMHDFGAKVKLKMWSIDYYHFFLPVYLYNLKFENGKYKTENSDFYSRFIKFLFHYNRKEYIEKFPLFAFSSILILLDMSNDCANFELTKKYYEPS
jgi:hypothetical protein